jgi:hypothetical protein
MIARTSNPAEEADRTASRIGFWAAIAMAVLTAASLSSDFTTPARSGRFCVTRCVAYPYVDTGHFDARHQHDDARHQQQAGYQP